VVAATPVPPERLTALAGARAERLRTLLVEERGVEAVRVSVAQASAEGDPGIALELAANVGDVVEDAAEGEAEGGSPAAP
jgi:hypothetical protein